LELAVTDGEGREDRAAGWDTSTCREGAWLLHNSVGSRSAVGTEVGTASLGPRRAPLDGEG